MSDSIAIAHKDYDVRGGGEVLSERLARMFDCPLFVGHGDPDNQPDGAGIDIREIAPESRWHRLMDMGGAPRGIAHMMHWRDNAPPYLEEFETVITSGNEPLWALTQDWQTKIAYTHSTPRWMYDLYHQNEGFIGRTYQQLQRRLYEGTVRRPDLWVANSDLVARRINKYWNIPTEQIRVVYPPVDTHNFSPDDAPTQGNYLYLGRLVGAKCVDDVIRAFGQLGGEYQLLIAGDGPEREQLEKQAGDNVEFCGFVSEQRKRELLSEAKALIYPPLNEDFGMVPIEAMAAGTPVIGVKEGFTRFQIQDGRNGWAYPRQGGHLRERIRHFEHEGVDWSETEIAAFAGRHFGTQQFEAGMRNAVKVAQARADVRPEFERWEVERSPEVMLSE